MAVAPDPPALAGIKVVSLAGNVPGPVAAWRLASMGATVTKVEAPAGDGLKAVGPGWYDELVAGQEVIVLDLKDTEDRAALETRLADADVLLTAMRPSALARLGLVASAQRHGLVLVEIVGYDGDRAEEPSRDLTFQALHGTINPPQIPMVPIVDLLAAERAVSATLAGLRRRTPDVPSPRERVVLDEAAFDAAAGIRHRINGPGDPLGGGLPNYDIYRTSDGYVAVGALEPHFAQRLSDAIGDTREALEGRFASQPSEHWESLGRTLDIPIVAVRARPARH